MYTIYICSKTQNIKTIYKLAQHHCYVLLLEAEAADIKIMILM